MYNASHVRAHAVWGVAATLLFVLLASSLAGLHAAPSSSPSSSAPATAPQPAITTHPASSTPPSAPSPTTLPAATPVLSSDGQSPAAIGLKWTDTTTGTFVNYTLQEASQATDWKFSTLTVIAAAGTTTYVAAGISPGGDYDWQVVEYSETCFIICSKATGQTTNLLNVTQPAVAFLQQAALIPTSITLNWTNNATYDGLISFDKYEVWKSVNGAAFELGATITNESANVSTLTLTSGDSYSFYVETVDCMGACTGGSPVTSTTQSNLLTVGTPLTLSVTVLAHSSAIDLGQSDFFSCTPSGGESPFAYSWDFGSGTLVAGSASESAALGVDGVDTVTCEVTDSEGPPAAHAEGSADVTVNSPLEVEVTMNRTAADVGQSIDFVCTAMNGSLPYTLNWIFGDGSTTSLADPAHDYAMAGDYSPTCSVSDFAGSVLAPSLPLVLSPTLTTAAQTSSVAAAPGTSLTFTGLPANGSGTYTAYLWSFGTGSSSTGESVDHSFGTTGQYSIDFEVTDSNGATATAAISVDVSNIDVAVTPIDASVHVGASITFTASASGGAGAPYNYTWTFGDGKTAYGASVTHSYSATGTDAPMLTVTDRLGASNTTLLPALSVAADPATPSWFAGWMVLLIALVVGAIIALFVLSRRRAAETSELEAASSAYVPPTHPSRTIHGSKICSFCGASNLPLRTTCVSCGKPLTRGPGS